MQRWRRFLGGQVMKKLSYRWFSVENFALIRGSWVIRANRNKMAAVCSLWSSLTWTVFKLFADFCSWKGKLTSTIVLWTTLAIILTLTSSKVNFTEWPIQRGGCCPEGPCLKTCDVRKKTQKTYNIYNSNKHLEAKILQYRKEKRAFIHFLKGQRGTSVGDAAYAIVAYTWRILLIFPPEN